MKTAKRSVLCICAAMILSGCDSLMSESYSSGSGQSESADNEIASSIADDIVSGIGSKLDEIKADTSLIYFGQSSALFEFAEFLKSDAISSEMKNSKYYEVISSLVKADCIWAEVGKSFADQDGSISSFKYQLGYYNIKSGDGKYYYIINGHDDGVYHYHTNYVNDELKEYFVEEVSVYDIEELTGIGDVLELYKRYAEYGKIIGSGKETVFGNELEYEDISLEGETTRFYYKNQYTLYTIDAVSGAYYKLANNPYDWFTVPFGYKEVSRDKFIYDLKNME